MTSRNRPLTLWPGERDYGVPLLPLSAQAGVLDVPLRRWGRETRKSRMHGTWHFYTADEKWSILWSRPEHLINSACVAAVEVNWSLSEASPRAVSLWAVYRKRYLSALWAHAGVRLLVDLHVPEAHAVDNLLGVPSGWGSYATRYSPDLDRQAQRARERARRDDVLLVVYGGGKRAPGHCAELRAIHVPEELDEVRRGA